MADTAREVDGDRLTRILPDALRATHEVIERHEVTEVEWMAVLGFLTEVGKQDEFVLLSDVTKMSVLVDATPIMARAASHQVTWRARSTGRTHPGARSR